MADHPPLENYREVARSVRGTPACAAIIGLLGTVERLEGEVAGEREARHKLEAALTGKDKAMDVLFERLSRAGVDCSDLIP